MSHNKKKRNYVMMEEKFQRKPKPEINKTVQCEYKEDSYICDKLSEKVCCFGGPKRCGKFIKIEPEKKKEEETSEVEEKQEEFHIGHCNHIHAQRYAKWEKLNKGEEQ